MYAQYNILNLQTGMLIGVPIPAEEEGNFNEINEAIKTALSEAE